MAPPGEHRRCGFCTPARQTRITIGGIAHERQVVGDRRRRHAELRDDACFIADGAPSTVHLHDPRAAHALRQILVGGADQHAIDARIASRRCRGGRQGVIGLEFNHRPRCDAER